MDAYTLYIVGLDLGVPSPVARLALVGGGLRAARSVVVVWSSWRRASAFILAIAASLALTPIVWLHYFALLVVVVALGAAASGRALVPPVREWSRRPAVGIRRRSRPP